MFVGLLDIMVKIVILGVDVFNDVWGECVLFGWDIKDIMFVVKGIVVFLFDWFLVIIGEIIYVDGGMGLIGV